MMNKSNGSGNAVQPDDALPEELMSANEAAIYLQNSEAKLAKMRHDGIGPAYVKADSPSGPVRYWKKDLDAWLASVRTGMKSN